MRLVDGLVVKKIEVHAAGVVLGMTITVGDRIRTFGMTNLSENYEYSFRPDAPVVGASGYEND